MRNIITASAMMQCPADIIRLDFFSPHSCRAAGSYCMHRVLSEMMSLNSFKAESNELSSTGFLIFIYLYTIDRLLCKLEGREKEKQ